MYIPKYYEENDLSVQQQLVKDLTLGLIITNGPSGLNANHIPFIIEEKDGSFGTLKAHLARDNPQVKELKEATECLVVFQGPHEYITPTWYHTKQITQKVVPTWNFAAVHVWGEPTIIDDPNWLKAQTGRLSDIQESSKSEPWKLSDAPEPYINVMLKGIVGLEIKVSRHLGKWKMSQEKKDKDVIGVIEGLKDLNTERADQVRKLVEERARISGEA
jgi:transcriptional regulator